MTNINSLLPYPSASDNSSVAQPLRTVTPYKSSIKKKRLFWSVLALGVLASFVFGYITAGVQGFVFAGAALLPLSLLIFLTFLFTRRSEVSLPLRLSALIWGAAGSTTLTFAIIGAQNALFGASNSTDAVVVQAAIVEEIAKAAFLFFLFYFMKRLINTPIAGLTLGILVGAGFAFLENILYFSMAYSQGGWENFLGTFFARAVMSFFLHSIATMFTGLFLGYVVSKKFGFFKTVLLTNAGLIAAMTLHGLWNGFSSLTTDGSWYWLYFLFWLPVVAVLVITVISIRRYSTRRWIHLLEESAQTGVIRIKQADGMKVRKIRKSLYKNEDSDKLIQWENSLRLSSFWKQQAESLPKKPRYLKRYNKMLAKQQQQLARLAQVSETV